MVSFARARTKSLLSKLWPTTVRSIKNEKADLSKSEDLMEKQCKQNKFFLEASKNGGIWFS